jgi:long-subunit fatty acid transport protein
MRIRSAVELSILLFPALGGIALGVDAVEVMAANHKAEARGGADVAVGDSALSQIDNPATLALTPRGVQALDFSTPIAILPASWEGPLGSADSEVKAAIVGQMGYALPIDDRLTIGAALHTRSGFGTRYYFRHLMIPEMRRRVGSDMKSLDLEFNAAYKITDKLMVGAGGRLDVTTAEFSTVLGPADIDFGRGYAYGGGFSLGLLYKLTPELNWGLSYRSPSWLGDLEGGHGKASLLGVLPLSLGRVAIDEFELPQRVATGLAWDVTDWCKLVGEVRWINWSNGFFQRFTVETELLNLRYPLPLGYHDQWAAMGGAEFKLSQHWRLGVGYHYVNQCVPNTHMLPEGDAIPHQHVTTGLRYEQDKWWVGVGYICAFEETLRGPGRSHIPLGFDYGVSEITQAQHVVTVGFGFRW